MFKVGDVVKAKGPFAGESFDYLLGETGQIIRVKAHGLIEVKWDNFNFSNSLRAHQFELMPLVAEETHMFKVGDTVEFAEDYSERFKKGVRGVVTHCDTRFCADRKALIEVDTSVGKVKAFAKRLKLVHSAKKTDEELAKEVREARDKYITAIGELQSRGYVCKLDGVTLRKNLQSLPALSIQKTITVTTTKEL